LRFRPCLLAGLALPRLIDCPLSTPSASHEYPASTAQVLFIRCVREGYSSTHEGLVGGRWVLAYASTPQVLFIPKGFANAGLVAASASLVVAGVRAHPPTGAGAAGGRGVLEYLWRAEEGHSSTHGGRKRGTRVLTAGGVRVLTAGAARRRGRRRGARVRTGVGFSAPHWCGWPNPAIPGQRVLSGTQRYSGLLRPPAQGC
jgi:hypothetical protein